MNLNFKVIDISKTDYFSISNRSSKTFGKFTHIFFASHIDYLFEEAIFNIDSRLYFGKLQVIGRYGN